MHGTIWKEEGERRIVIIISLSQIYKSKFVLMIYKTGGVIISSVYLKVELDFPTMVEWLPCEMTTYAWNAEQ